MVCRFGGALPPRLSLSAVLALLVVLPLGVSGVLVGVDLGSQFFKAAIVSPGKAFDVVHNTHSKRKTPTAVSFHEKVRAFGDDAIAAAARGLRKTPMFFPLQLGRNTTGQSDSLPWLPTRFYPYNLATNSSGSVRFVFDEEDGFTTEEVAAHVLAFAKTLAEKAADGNPTSDAVITVPSTATQSQRLALLGAAEIARLPRVQLIHETSAAALQRALDLDFSSSSAKNTSTVLYYNMGARRVEVCVVAYRAAMGPGKKPTVALDVLGCSATDALGGHHVDLLISEKMRVAFGKKHPKLEEGLGTSVRALRKLEKEAMNLKHVLSVNREAQFRVEALYEDTDFQQQVSREEFENWCSELFQRFSQPIEAALAASNTTLEAIDTVEVIGGGWRIPKVQSLLSEYLQSHRPSQLPALNLSQHLNGEEAMAMGAAFFGANSSASFRTKKIYFTDVMQHRYNLTLEPLDKSQPHQEGWIRHVELFPRGTKLGAKKTVKLNIAFDLRVTVLENGNRVVVYELTRLHEAAAGQFASLPTPSVSLKLALDMSGVVRLTSAQATFDEPAEGASGGAASDRSSQEASDDADSSEGEAANTTAEGSGDAEAANTTSEGSGDSEANETGEASGNDTNQTGASKKAKTKKRKVTLDVIPLFVGIKPRPLSADEVAHASKRLQEMEAADQEVRNIEAAKNSLESFVYESREKLTGDELCLQVSTEAEREAIVEELTAAENWLYEDEAMSASAAVFAAKLKGLDEKVGPIKARVYELEQRPLMTELVTKTLNYTKTTLEFVRRNMTWVEEKDLQLVANMSEKFETWYANVTTLQQERALTEEPAYRAREVKTKLDKLRKEAQRLRKIRKIDPKPYSDFGRYGYGYDEERMRAFYRNLSNASWNGTNGSNWWRNFSNFSNFSGWNDSEYLRSFRDAENLRNTTGDQADKQEL